MDRSAPRVLLALDTSSSRARVALVAEDGHVLADAENDNARHAPHLLTLCDRVLKTARVSLTEIRAIACGAGPGHFTGLRIGLAAGKGLAFAADLPVYLVSSLEALALDLVRIAGLTRPASSGLPVEGSLSVWPCIDAGKGEVHLQGFAAVGSPSHAAAAIVPLAPAVRCAATEVARLFTRAEDPPIVASAAGARGIAYKLLGGSGLDRHRETIGPLPPGSFASGPHVGPTAYAVAQIAFERALRGAPDDLDAASPQYGRPPDITRPRQLASATAATHPATFDPGATDPPLRAK